MIVKNFSKILIVFFVFIFANSYCFAETDSAKLINQGNSMLAKIENNENPELNGVYLNKALYYFYVASKKKNPSTEALIGLGRTYMQKDRFSDAKNALLQAYSMDYMNPEANYYLAQYHYKFENYDTALKFYNSALIYGYKNKQENYLMLAKCYEKLGDLDNAIMMYEKVGTSDATEKAKQLKIINETKDEE